MSKQKVATSRGYGRALTGTGKSKPPLSKNQAPVTLQNVSPKQQSNPINLRVNMNQQVTPMLPQRLYETVGNQRNLGQGLGKSYGNLSSSIVKMEENVSIAQSVYNSGNATSKNYGTISNSLNVANSKGIKKLIKLASSRDGHL